MAANLNGVTGLTLDAPTLAAIYQGRITRWSDPALAALWTSGVPVQSLKKRVEARGVRVLGVEVGVGVGGPVDRDRRRLRPRQIGCDLLANPLVNRHRALAFRM